MCRFPRIYAVFQNAPLYRKKCQKENDSFFYRFPFDTPFQLFSTFQRISRLVMEVIVFRLPVFLEFRTFFRHENAPQLRLYQNWGANMAKDSNFDTMHPAVTSPKTQPNPHAGFGGAYF